MVDIELVGVPFDGYGRPGNQAHAATALRAAGLGGAFRGHRVAAGADLSGLAPASTERGTQTGLINEAALLSMVTALNRRVDHALGDGHFPVVYGGDCTTLLGIVTGVRDHLGPTGLVFVDGHEDTMPLDVSEDGEAANTEIGLLLGLTGRLMTGELAAALPALSPEHLAVLGTRDEDWRRRFNVGSLREMGVWLRDLTEVAADPAGCGARAVRHIRASASDWWLHVDLDVLDPEVFAAQGLPDVDDEPGGLGWPALTAALRVGGCRGLSIAIYDPDQDPDGNDAARIVTLLTELADAL